MVLCKKIGILCCCFLALGHKAFATSFFSHVEDGVKRFFSLEEKKRSFASFVLQCRDGKERSYPDLFMTFPAQANEKKDFFTALTQLKLGLFEGEKLGDWLQDHLLQEFQPKDKEQKEKGEEVIDPFDWRSFCQATSSRLFTEKKAFSKEQEDFAPPTLDQIYVYFRSKIDPTRCSEKMYWYAEGVLEYKGVSYTSSDKFAEQCLDDPFFDEEDIDKVTDLTFCFGLLCYTRVHITLKIDKPNKKESILPYIAGKQAFFYIDSKQLDKKGQMPLHSLFDELMVTSQGITYRKGYGREHLADWLEQEENERGEGAFYFQVVNKASSNKKFPLFMMERGLHFSLKDQKRLHTCFFSPNEQNIELTMYNTKEGTGVPIILCYHKHEKLLEEELEQEEGMYSMRVHRDHATSIWDLIRSIRYIEKGIPRLYGHAVFLFLLQQIAEKEEEDLKHLLRQLMDSRRQDEESSDQEDNPGYEENNTTQEEDKHRKEKEGDDASEADEKDEDDNDESEADEEKERIEKFVNEIKKEKAQRRFWISFRPKKEAKRLSSYTFYLTNRCILDHAQGKLLKKTIDLSQYVLYFGLEEQVSLQVCCLLPSSPHTLTDLPYMEKEFFLPKASLNKEGKIALKKLFDLFTGIYLASEREKEQEKEQGHEHARKTLKGPELLGLLMYLLRSYVEDEQGLLPFYGCECRIYERKERRKRRYEKKHMEPFKKETLEGIMFDPAKELLAIKVMQLARTLPQKINGYQMQIQQPGCSFERRKKLEKARKEAIGRYRKEEEKKMAYDSTKKKQEVFRLLARKKQESFFSKQKKRKKTPPTFLPSPTPTFSTSTSEQVAISSVVPSSSTPLAKSPLISYMEKKNSLRKNVCEKKKNPKEKESKNPMQKRKKQTQKRTSIKTETKKEEEKKVYLYALVIFVVFGVLIKAAASKKKRKRK